MDSATFAASLAAVFAAVTLYVIWRRVAPLLSRMAADIGALTSRLPAESPAAQEIRNALRLFNRPAFYGKGDGELIPLHRAIVESRNELQRSGARFMTDSVAGSHFFAIQRILLDIEQDFAARFPQICTALNSLPADLAPEEMIEFRNELENNGTYEAAVALLDRRRNEIQQELSLAENRLRAFTGQRVSRASA